MIDENMTNLQAELVSRAVDTHNEIAPFGLIACWRRLALASEVVFLPCSFAVHMRGIFTRLFAGSFIDGGVLMRRVSAGLFGGESRR